MVRTRLRVVTSVIGGTVVLFLGSLAFNAASSQSRWPGVLDLVRRYPWFATVLLAPFAIATLWPQHEPSAPAGAAGARDGAAPAGTFRMPPRNPSFTGREPLLATMRAALASHHTVTVHALQGMGGVGKTQLAIEFAYRYLDRYSFVGFIDAERPELIASQFVVLATALGISDPVSEQAVSAVYQRLAEHPPWLMIFDNASEQFNPASLLPTGRAVGGHIVVTTRYRGWVSLGTTLELDVFDRGESVAALRRRVPALSPGAADLIADLLGDLPLAITQAAGYLEYSGIPPEEYARLLGTQLEAMIERGDRMSQQGVAVATLWNLSVRDLESTHPPAVALLRLCSMFAPEPVPLDVITGHVEVLTGALRSVAADPVSWNDVVGAAVGRSLARRDGNRLILHRLVQAAIRRAMPEEIRGPVHATACRLLVAETPDDVRDHPTRWMRWQELLPHALAVTEQPGLPEVQADVATLLRVSGRCIRNVGDPLVARPLAERALAIDERLFGPTHPNVADDLYTLAQIFRDLGEPATALPMLERALAIHEAAVGDATRGEAPDERFVGYDLALLALVLRDLGRSASARPLIERALRIDTTIYGPDHGYIADDLTTLARIWHDLGSPDVALPLARRALAIDERLYGDTHTYVGIDSIIVARILRDIGDTVASRELAARAQAIFEARPGFDYRWTLEDRRLLTVLNSD